MVATTQHITQQQQVNSAAATPRQPQRLLSSPQVSSLAGGAARRTASAGLVQGSRIAAQAVVHQGTSSPRLPAQQWVVRVGSSTPRLPVRSTNTATYRTASQPRPGRYMCSSNSGTASVPTKTTTTTPTTPSNGGCIQGSPRQLPGPQRLLLEPVAAGALPSAPPGPPRRPGI